MQSGRLDYAYRLSAARLAILRLRLARRWHRLFPNRSSTARKNVLRGLTGVAFLIAVPGSVWLGYRAGQQAEVDPIEQAKPIAIAVISQPATQETDVAAATERPIAATPETTPASKIPVVSASDRIEREKEDARLSELASLRKMVGQLQAQVQALEEEATGLEVELLDQQIAFSKEEERWKEASVERRVVYNITNIPVGESVSEERMQRDAEMADLPVPQSDFTDQAEVLEQPPENQKRQEVFFGPAPDQYDDWVNP